MKISSNPVCELFSTSLRSRLCVQHMSKTDAAPLFESCSEGGVMTAHTKGLIKRKKQTEETNVRHLRSRDLVVLCDKSNLTVVNFTFSAGSSPL